jgi:hypothetical protein
MNQHFTLIRSLSPKSPKPAMEYKSGHITYMGQILKQLGQEVLRRDEKQVLLVTDILGLKPCPPFTLICNGKLVQSDLATHIINSPPENEARIISLLAAHNITVSFED